jgi:predicted ester cyclase
LTTTATWWFDRVIKVWNRTLKTGCDLINAKPQGDDNDQTYTSCHSGGLCHVGNRRLRRRRQARHRVRYRRQVRQVLQREHVQRLEKFKAETGIAYGEFEIANEAQREQAIRNFADQGYSPIIAAGFAQASALEKVAKEYPELKFAIVDMVVDLPNVQSIVFNEHEGSYIVGILAGMASKSGKVGFVGGMDIPLIRKFACGYAQGVKAAKADATIFQNMTGDTGAAWNDPVKGGEITKGQMAQGADVIYAAAGATGLGVLQAAADGGALSIGVDANQNYLHPGKVLTSMLKRVDVAVYNVMKSGKDGKLQGGHQRSRPQGGRRRLCHGRHNKDAGHARDEGRRRQGQGRHHRRHHQGARLHHRQHLPGAVSQRTASSPAARRERTGDPTA